MKTLSFFSIDGPRHQHKVDIGLIIIKNAWSNLVSLDCAEILFVGSNRSGSAIKNVFGETPFLEGAWVSFI
jgi:hypothetical protein